LPGRRNDAGEEGFTLVEALIAFAVLSIVLTIVSWATASGLQLNDRGARQQIALREAQSLLESAGYVYPLQPGQFSGRTSSGRYAWSLEMATSGAPNATGLRDAQGRLAVVYTIKAAVFWRDRFAEQGVTLTSGRLGYAPP